MPDSFHSSEQPEKQSRVRQKVQVWIFRAGDEGVEKGASILLLKTNASRGGFWQPVTGSVEKDEALPDAALREAEEETGLSFSTPPLPLDYTFSFSGQWGPATEHAFALQAEGGSEVRLDPSEHDDSAWLKPSEVLARLKYESNAEGFKRLQSYLEKNLK